jgi:DNA-directed RNA polymerase subunit RPC12/RpoP
MKKAIVMLFLCLTLLAVSSCGAKKILHCDKCNAEVKVAADSEMDESWDIRCSDCNK